MKYTCLAVVLISSFFNFSVHTACAQWVQTSGPGDQMINVLASCRSNLYAGTIAGVYQSSDKGLSWNVSNTLFSSDTINALVVMGNSIFVGTGHNGIYLSTNDGMTWAPDNTGLTNHYILSGTVDDTNVLIGTESGIFVSSNGGVSWSALSSDLSNLGIESIDANGAVLLAGTLDYLQARHALYRSTNYGQSWTEVGTPSGIPSNTYIESLVQVGANTFAGTLNHGVLLSPDSGRHWVPINTGLPSNLFNINTLAAVGTLIFSSTLDSNDNPNLYFSSNNGAVWISANQGLSDLATSFAVLDTNLFAGTYMTGVWRRPLYDFGISSVPIPQQTNTAISLYPNPAVRKITLRFTASDGGYATITMLNALGAEVASTYLGELSESEHSITWILPSELTPGEYECELDINGTLQLLPIILK